MQNDQTRQNIESEYFEVKYSGYNIFKDSIRKIDDLEKYN